MKTNRLISFGKVLAILILILGIIHDVATFSPLIKGGLSCLPAGSLKAMIYMSLICGTSLILSGAVLLLLLPKAFQYPFLTKTILTVGIFLSLNGILAVAYMPHNPFAWISLLLTQSMLSVAIGIKMTVEK